MRWIIEPQLRDRVVFDAARRDPALQELYHRRFADCHELADPARRDRAFSDLHAEWFEQMGFGPLLRSLAEEHQFIRMKINAGALHAAAGRRGGYAELFGREGDYRLLICCPPTLLLDAEAFGYWARHELQHIDDILDPAFAYDDARRLEGSSAAAADRTRERYAVLWAMSVDARLSARGAAHPQAQSRRQHELRRAYRLNSHPGLQSALDGLWREWTCLRPMHAALLRWARDGLPWLQDHGPTSSAAAHGQAGETCPLCRFATFDWADPSGLDDALIAAVQSDFPAWTADRAFCGQCAELYRGRTRARAHSFVS